MGERAAARRTLIGQLLLAGVGALLLLAGLWGYFGAQNGKLVGGFFVLTGMVLVLFAAFYSRVDGIVELGLLKVPSERARRAEKQFKEGRVVAQSGLDDARTAVDEALARYRIGGAAGILGPTGRREVVLVDDAVIRMATLAKADWMLVRAALASMSDPMFQPLSDPQATRSDDGTRAYRMRRVPGSGVRIWYRQLSESQPNTLCVMVIQHTNEDD